MCIPFLDRCPGSLALALAPILGALPAIAGPVVHVTFDKSLRAEPATGRLVVYLIMDGAAVGPGASPADGPFWEDPQPLFGIDAKDLRPGQAATVDDTATCFPSKLSALPYGTYRAQAVLDVHRDNSAWRKEPGNLFSEVVTFAISDRAPSPVVDLPLTDSVRPRKTASVPGIEIFETRSALLSDFHLRDAMLRAGVVLPAGYDPASPRLYPAVYEVPGFGGDHTGAFGHARRNRHDNSPTGVLAENCFWIVLDPESGNGHTLFANSANNGPCADALIKELIPALEAKYHLLPKPAARLLRGHSSGGWSTLWLATQYPDTFGATWSTSPDPVDFHRMQLVDIYGRANMYAVQVSEYPNPPRTTHLPDTPSFRVNGQPKMTIRQENLMEEVLGPDNTSGQQWDSWQAVAGPRNANGNPAALYDPVTGDLDHAVAEQYRKYDIADLLRKVPGHYGLIFKQRVRLLVGDQDSFYLNEAVALLKPEVDELNFVQLPEGDHGYIKILPGFDHGSIFRSPEMQAIPAEMVEHLRRHNLIPAADADKPGQPKK